MKPVLHGIAAVLILSVSALSQVLPGQIIRCPEHPQWLMRSGGEHLFISGPGDPENFLYRGTRLPDGTRDGDQDELIDKLIAEGGNCLYFETIRSHGGDGPADHNPFIDSNETLGIDQDILDQWETWFTRMDDAGILIYLHIYDDSARVWSTGNQVGPDEEAYLTAIVDEFEHHENLIWIVSEESEEAMSDSRTRAIAQVMADADEHDHLVGNHHHSGTIFKAWLDGSALNLYSMHYDVSGDAMHTGAVMARDLGEAAGAAGNGYITLYTEATSLTATSPDSVVRGFLWHSAMGGVMPMVYKMDIANTPVAQLNQCRTQQQFFEATDFYTMDSRDDLVHAGTKWMLANPPHSYIAYADGANGDLGVSGLTLGNYDALWVDTVTGTQVLQEDLVLAGGDTTFARPVGIGDECAVWVHRVWRDMGQALGGTNGLPTLEVESTMVEGAPLTLRIENALGNALVAVFVGFANLSLPFEGGVLVPTPDLLEFIISAPDGSFEGSTTWPAGFPSGAPLYIQAWVLDAAGPFGLAATNGVEGIAP